MSCVIVVAPVLTANWPILAAAIIAAGLRVAAPGAATSAHRVELEVDSAEILPGSDAPEQMSVESNGVRATFFRDGRGALRVCVEGAGKTKPQLRAAGREMIDRVTQQFVYHRLVSELKSRHMTIVHEEIGPDRTVKLRVRNPAF